MSEEGNEIERPLTKAVGRRKSAMSSPERPTAACTDRAPGRYSTDHCSPGGVSGRICLMPLHTGPDSDGCSTESQDVRGCMITVR